MRGDGEKRKEGKPFPLYKESSPSANKTLNPDDIMPYTLKRDQSFHIRN
jgi:hypothetical protein